jgi:uncharacterized protein YbjQ (UPF0145 family)
MPAESDMITTNLESLPDKKISEHLGLVRGNTVRARNVGSDIGAFLKSLVGGEIKGYVKVMNTAREEALNEMLYQADELNADAVVNIRFTTSQVMPQAAEILAYGTAVKLTDTT